MRERIFLVLPFRIGKFRSWRSREGVFVECDVFAEAVGGVKVFERAFAAGGGVGGFSFYQNRKQCILNAYKIAHGNDKSCFVSN